MNWKLIAITFIVLFSIACKNPIKPGSIPEEPEQPSEFPDEPSGILGNYIKVGELTEGDVGGKIVEYITEASFDGYNVDVMFKGNTGFDNVWLVIPKLRTNYYCSRYTNSAYWTEACRDAGYHVCRYYYSKMDRLTENSNIWNLEFSRNENSMLEYYFFVRKGDDRANNKDLPHSWFLTTGIPSLHNVSASVFGKKEGVELSWECVKGVEGYRIYRYKDRFDDDPVVMESDSIVYNDDDLSENTPYFYKVSFIKNNEESEKSGFVFGIYNRDIIDPFEPDNDSFDPESIEQHPLTINKFYGALLYSCHNGNSGINLDTDCYSFTAVPGTGYTIKVGLLEPLSFACSSIKIGFYTEDGILIRTQDFTKKNMDFIINSSSEEESRIFIKLFADNAVNESEIVTKVQKYEITVSDGI